MSYKGQVLRGEKWFHLLKNGDFPLSEDMKKDIETYKASVEKVKAEKENKSKEKK